MHCQELTPPASDQVTLTPEERVVAAKILGMLTRPPRHEEDDEADCPLWTHNSALAGWDIDAAELHALRGIVVDFAEAHGIDSAGLPDPDDED